MDDSDGRSEESACRMPSSKLDHGRGENEMNERKKRHREIEMKKRGDVAWKGGNVRNGKARRRGRGV
jgi:hypothetical protein